MTVRMVGDFGARIDNLAKYMGIQLSLPAKHEECCSYTMFFQYINNHGREVGIRPIVKCQCRLRLLI